MSTPGLLSDPRVDAVRRFVSRYAPFLAVTLAILLIAILLPGRQAADTVDDTATGITDTTIGDVPIEDAAKGNVAAKGGPSTVDTVRPSAPVAPPADVIGFEEAKKKGVALVANCDQERGRIMIPTRFAPPCTQKYVAPNAGATWQGVTDKEIVLAYYNGAGDAASEADPQRGRRERLRRRDQGAGPRLGGVPPGPLQPVGTQGPAS